MDVTPGSRLGPYEIVSRLGAGGMGEVFRAKDTRLDRSVAIKVLPAELSRNSQFKVRFEREAKAISQLNHPNICTLYDVGDDYLVMELLEGQNLAERLARGPLSLQEVLRYGTQIAEALVVAHRAGIVHRDLKPGNIMITKSGAKLLDFGLAKAALNPSSVVSGTAFSGATEHRPLTQEGTIIGTFQYMAPEQLEGQEADARTDIFAFGAVLYEMVTGKRAFEGKTKTSLIAAIVDRDPPPISSFQPLSPPALERVIRICLAKDPDDRWQTAHDLLLQLRWIAEAGSEAGVAAPVTVRRKNRERIAWAMALFLLATTATFAYLWRRLADRPVERVEMSVLPPDKMAFASSRGGPSISPDGRHVVYIASLEGRSQLWLRRLSAGAAQALHGTDSAFHPFWSPDSRFIGYFAGGKLRKIDISGGPPQTICDAPNGRGGTWNREGVIVFTPSDRDPLHRVAANGGASVPITDLAPDLEYSHRWPSFLPDGKHYLFLAQNMSAEQDRGRIYIGELGTKERKELLAVNSPALYSPPGFILFARDRSLLAQRFDPDSLKLAGDAFPLADNLHYTANTSWAAFAVAGNGTICYQRSDSAAATQLTWFDRAGKQLGILNTTGEHINPRLSRKGDRVAYGMLDADTGNSDIWIYDLERNIPTRFTFEAVRENNPVWSPDDARILYSAEVPNRTERNIVQKISSGAGREEVLFATRAPNLTTIDVSPDGRTLTFNQVDPRTRTSQDVWTFDFATRKGSPLFQSKFVDGAGLFSPNGRWIAYISDESGQREVYVQPFPPNGAKWQISSKGGRAPRWRRDGKELFFFGLDTRLQSAAVNTEGTTFSAGVPQSLFEARVIGGYDVSMDGQRFLINQTVAEDAPAPLTVVLNWTAGLPK